MIRFSLVFVSVTFNWLNFLTNLIWSVTTRFNSITVTLLSWKSLMIHRCSVWKFFSKLIFMQCKAAQYIKICALYEIIIVMFYEWNKISNLSRIFSTVITLSKLYIELSSTFVISVTFSIKIDFLMLKWMCRKLLKTKIWECSTVKNMLCSNSWYHSFEKMLTMFCHI